MLMLVSSAFVLHSPSLRVIRECLPGTHIFILSVCSSVAPWCRLPSASRLLLLPSWSQLLWKLVQRLLVSRLACPHPGRSHEGISGSPTSERVKHQKHIHRADVDHCPAGTAVASHGMLRAGGVLYVPASLLVCATQPVSPCFGLWLQLSGLHNLPKS